MLIFTEKKYFSVSISTHIECIIEIVEHFVNSIVMLMFLRPNPMLRPSSLVFPLPCLQYCNVLLALPGLTHLVSVSPLISLAHLSLRHNQIGEEGARLIGSALSTTQAANKSLVSLNLAFNSIGDAGTKHIAQVLYV